MSILATTSARIVTISRAEFCWQFGSPNLVRGICGYTREEDTRAVLTLLCHAQPLRVLEIGTAFGHMTANLTRWTADDARIFSIDLVRGMPRARPGAVEQQVEVPAPSEWARFANHFGAAHKVFFITADTVTYDFGRIAPLDFAFIDGGHDLDHVLNDSRKAYEALSPGGWIVWHDFNSPVPWVKVREAIEQIGFAEPVVHVEGTEVAFLRKGTAESRQWAVSSGQGNAGMVEAFSDVKVAWEADFEGLHSLAIVNRAICDRLVDRGCQLQRVHDATGQKHETPDRDDAALIHVRHRWPPRLEPPQHGKWVLMQPWEYGSLPRAWLPMLGQVDEVWAYSRYVRDCYLRAGVPPERVHVIPLGVDPDVFRPGLEPLPAPVRPASAISVRRRDDLPQRDRCVVERLR